MYYIPIHCMHIKSCQNNKKKLVKFHVWRGIANRSWSMMLMKSYSVKLKTVVQACLHLFSVTIPKYHRLHREGCNKLRWLLHH